MNPGADKGAKMYTYAYVSYMHVHISTHVKWMMGSKKLSRRYAALEEDAKEQKESLQKDNEKVSQQLECALEEQAHLRKQVQAQHR